MPPCLGELIKQARHVCQLTLRHLANQVMKDDGTPIGPQYLFDIEVHYRVPAPHVLRELARVLELEYDTLLALSGGADVVVREYLQRHPEAEAAGHQALSRGAAAGVPRLGSAVPARRTWP